ncbi:MAG: zinc ribbon domain-containing protein [Acidobacteriota bacterium]
MQNCHKCARALDEEWNGCPDCGHRARGGDCERCQAEAQEREAIAAITEAIRTQRLALENLLRVVSLVIHEETAHNEVSLATVMELGLAAQSVRNIFQIPVEPLTLIIFNRKEWTPNNAKLS